MTTAETITPAVAGSAVVGRVVTHARLAWVPLALMRVAPLAQRELRGEWVNELIRDFNPDRVGVLTVNYREGYYYVVDGQHRVEAMRGIGWEDQQVECRVYENLTIQEEAELFLALNKRLAVGPIPQYKVGLTACRPEEMAIQAVLEPLNLRVGQGKVDGSITAVGTLRRIYREFGAETLSRALAIIVSAYGDEGLTAGVIDGLGMFVARYGQTVKDDDVIETLRNARAGVRGLVNIAESIRQNTGAPKHQCIGAAAVRIYNAPRRGRAQLRDWFKVTSTGVPKLAETA
jgi:hypothetical protein